MIPLSGQVPRGGVEECRIVSFTTNDEVMVKSQYIFSLT